MVIVRQEHIFKYNAKNKFVDCWMILTHELDGPSLALFKDQSAKKLVENRLVLNPLASRIRFGTTTLNLDTGITPAPSFFPQIKASDVRVHSSCFILIQTERLVRKQRRPHYIWLCAKSTQQLFEIVKVISSCLVSMKVAAPLSNPMDDLNALHRYRPKPFEAKSDWENFWDNPPKITTDLQPNSSADLLRNSGIAMSMGALNVMQMDENSSKLDGSKKSYINKSLYSSSPALETQQQPSLLLQHQNDTRFEAFRTRSSSRSSTTSRDSRMSHSRIYPNNANFAFEEALPPIYELKRDRELIEKSKTSSRSRLYEPKSGGSAMETVYSTPGGKSANSKKANRYTARRESALSNSGVESGDTSSVYRAFGNVPTSREVTHTSGDSHPDQYPPSPHSILKNKAVVQAPQNPKYSSGSGGYTTSSTRSTHTQTPRKSSSSSRRRQSEMSVVGVDITSSCGNTPPYMAIQNVDYTDAEAQTEHNKAGSHSIPLISIGNNHPINVPKPTEDEFQSQVQKLKQVSQPHNPIDTPVTQHLSNGHATPMGLSLAPPTAPIRKLTPTAPNPIALAAVAAAAAQSKQAAKNNISHFSSSDGGSMSSDFDDDDNQSNHTRENSSGASTPRMMSNEKSTEERIYRITVEGTSKF